MTDLKPPGDLPDLNPPAATERQPVWRLGVIAALILAVGIFYSWWVALFIVALIGCIFLHELGHYLTARSAGMKVTEFFIGFGPKIFGKQKGETEYGVKAIPAGAYVRIIGMNNLDEVEVGDEDRTYRQKGYWRRMSVAVAGSAMHFAIALVLLFVTLAAFGVPRADAWSVASLSPASPATAAGLALGDRVLAINGQSVDTFGDLTNIVRTKPGETVTLSVKKANGETVDVTTTLASANPTTGENVGFLGIGETRAYVKDSVPGAVPGAVKEFGSVAWQSVAGLGKIFSPNGIRDYVNTLQGQDVGGTGHGTDNRLLSPLGAGKVAKEVGNGGGFAGFFYLLAAINIFIGIFNLIPLPPFDGGHAAVATYEAVRSRRGRRYYADAAKLMPVAYAVLGVLAILTIGNLYLDAARL